MLRRVSASAPAEIGLLATVGCAQVPVFRPPRVAVLATGDELVEPHQTPPPGAVRDSNRFALMAAAAGRGRRGRLARARARRRGGARARDARRRLTSADVLITSGGVSMGTRDLIKPLLDRMATIQFGRVSFKPGKPLTFATTGEGKLCFGLPGFPVSSLVTFEVFVRPALLKLAAPTQVHAAARRGGRSATTFDPMPIRPEYQRATVTWEEHHFVARDDRPASVEPTDVDRRRERACWRSIRAPKRCQRAQWFRRFFWQTYNFQSPDLNRSYRLCCLRLPKSSASSKANTTSPTAPSPRRSIWR